MTALSGRGMLLKGGVAGGLPPHKGGPKARPSKCEERAERSEEREEDALARANMERELAKVWSFETQKADISNGCIPALGWEQSGGESVPAVAGVVYRLLARRSVGSRSGRTVESVSWGGCESRHMAGTYGDLMGLAGRGLAGHLRFGTCYE